MKTSKKLKKLTALFLVLVLALCMTAPAAASGEDGDNTSPTPTPTSSEGAGEGGDAGEGEGGDKNDAETPTDTGTVTIKNAGAGVTYKLYKLFDAAISDDTKDGASNSILYSGTIPTELTEYFETDDYNHIVATDEALDSTDEKALDENGTLVDANTILSEKAREKLKKWANAQKEPTATNSSENGGTLVFENLPFGYYVLTADKSETDTTDNTYDLIVVTSVNPTATIYDKNLLYPTTVDDKELKYLTYPDRDANAAVGDTVSFTIAFTTQNIDGPESNLDSQFITSYVITDTPTGLDFDTSSIKITMKATNYSSDTKTHELTYDSSVDASYMITAWNSTYPYIYGVEKDTDSGKVTIRIPWGYYNDLLSTYSFLYGVNNTVYEVTITYDATVTAEAAETGIIKNQATVDWGREGYSLPGDVDINIASFELNKVNEDGDTIEGAQFKLQTPSTNTLGGNTYRTEKLMKVTDENGDEYYRIATGKEVANGEATNIIEAGDVYIKGLDLDKDYQLVEVTAPDGYNKIDDPITITKCTEKEYLEKKQETDATITQKMVEEASTDKYVFEDVEVTNLTGSTLPSTGGIGTTIFYIVGGVLAVGALVLLITRKRVHLEHE